MSMKILAREWLIFLACVSVAWVIVPIIVALFRGSMAALEWYKLLTTSDFFGTSLVTLVPYAFVQFVRSIIWAVKASRGDGKGPPGH